MTRRSRRWLIGLGIPVVLIGILVAVWRWDWFIPLVESRASAALGRTVTIGHMHVTPGRITRVSLDDITVANPPGWHGDPFAQIARLTVDVSLWDYIRHGALVVPLVAVDQPVVRLSQLPNGDSNYQLQLAGGSGGSTKIGDLRIDKGRVYALLAKLKADLALDVGTRQEGNKAQIVATAHGTYGDAPITGKAVGGALLSLRDPSQPWPIDLRLENGATHVALVGTLQDPLHLAGADLKLQFAGQDMSQLEKLVGFPIPKTPPFRLTGQLDFADGHVLFKDFQGRVGSSDLEGTIKADPGKERMSVTADLRSRQVDLADLGGFIGAEPGRTSTPGQTPAKRAEVAKAESKPTLLPDTPISVPRLQWADVHLRYRGEHIKGRSVPLDDLVVTLDLVNGGLNLHPVSFAVGQGRINGDVALTPNGKLIHTKADIALKQVDVSRLMAATHVFHGAGTVSGTARLDATGNSLAAMLANGNGGVRLGMTGGNLSALLVDLSGLQFGNAVLSALGLPQRTPVECFVGDLALRQGIMTIQALVLDTGDDIINGAGSVNLRDETLNLHLRTETKHFTIGSLPTPINIGGTFKSPRILPGAELAARGGLAAGLAAIFPPLALLPTIQFGTEDSHQCDRLLHEARQKPGGERVPAPKNAEAGR